jgi:hypothetical protein
MMAQTNVSKLVIYPFTFFSNDQKITITGMEATKAERAILLNGLII